MGLHALESIPFADYIILAIDPKDCMDAMHPWLLYARFKLRKICKEFYLSKDQVNELAQVVEYLKSSLPVLKKSKVPPKNSKGHYALVCQLSYELGVYSFIVEDWATAQTFLDQTKMMMDGFKITEECDWMYFLIILAISISKF